MRHMPKVVTLTMNPTIDVSCEVDQVVAERKLRCSDPVREPGGGGLNVSRAIANLGGSSTAVYTAGGATGSLLRQMLDADGRFAHAPVEVAGWTREGLTFTETTTGRQYRFGMPGPALSEREWAQALAAAVEAVHAGDYLVVSGSLPPGVPAGFEAETITGARARGARTVVDTSGAALREAASAGAFMVKPNLRELAQAVGADYLDDAAQEDAARALVDLGCEVVVTSLGSRGVLLARRDGPVERIPAPAVPVRSKVGAGDSTVAGVVLGLSQGRSIAEAVRLGVAAGAAAVMTPGTALCTREDTERLFAALAGQAPGQAPDKPWTSLVE